MKGGCVMADETAADTGGRESLAYELAVWRAEVERTASELGAWIGKPGRTPEPVAKAYDALTVLLARDGATAADDVNEANKYAYQAGEALHSSRRDRDAWRARAEKAENELRGVRADLEAAREEIRHTRRLEDRERDVRILRTAMVAAGGDLKDAIRADMDGDRADAVRRAADELDKGLQSAGVANRPNPAAPLPSVPEPSVTYADLERVARRMAAMLENIPEDFRPDEPKGMSVADVGERLALAVARLVTWYRRVWSRRDDLASVAHELQAFGRAGIAPGDIPRWNEARKRLAKFLTQTAPPDPIPDDHGDDDKGTDDPAARLVTAAELEALEKRVGTLEETARKQATAIRNLGRAAQHLAEPKPDPVLTVMTRYAGLMSRVAMKLATDPERPHKKASVRHWLEGCEAFLKTYQRCRQEGKPLMARANADGAESFAVNLCTYLGEAYHEDTYRLPE